MIDRKVYEEIEKINAKLFCALRDIEDLKRNITLSRNQIADLEKLYEEFNKFNELKRQYEASFASFAKSSHSIERKQENLTELFNMINGDFTSYKEGFQKQKDELEHIFNLLGSMREDFESKFRQHEQEQKNQIEKIRIELKTILENLKKDLVVPPTEIVTQNQLLMKKIEGAVIDSNNAMLKINNQDTFFRILEKKIETISIQVKKLELAIEERKL